MKKYKYINKNGNFAGELFHDNNWPESFRNNINKSYI